MLQRRMEFVGKLVTGSTDATALRAAALDHELRNHAVKNQSVVERPLLFLPGFFVSEFLCPFGQPDKIGHRLRRLFLKQPRHNISLRGLKNRVSSCCSAHAFSLLNESSYTSRTVPRHSPALLLAQLGDVRRVMFPVPFIQEQQPVD